MSEGWSRLVVEPAFRYSKPRLPSQVPSQRASAYCLHSTIGLRSLYALSACLAGRNTRTRDRSGEKSDLVGVSKKFPTLLGVPSVQGETTVRWWLSNPQAGIFAAVRSNSPTPENQRFRGFWFPFSDCLGTEPSSPSHLMCFCILITRSSQNSMLRCFSGMGSWGEAGE